MNSRLIVIAGIQGAGKSTLANYIVSNGLESDLIDIPKGSVHIDIDQYVKTGTSSAEYLKPYYADIAFGIIQGRDVIITTAPSGIKGHVKRIQDSHHLNLKGKIEMLFMPCEVNTAISRCETRCNNGGHFVDKEALSAWHKRIPAFIQEIKQDNIPIYDIEHKTGGEPKVTANNSGSYISKGFSK